MEIKKCDLKAFNGKSLDRNVNTHWEVFWKRDALEQKCTETYEVVYC